VIRMPYVKFSKKNLDFMRRKIRKLYGSVLDVGGGDTIDRLKFTPGDYYVCLDLKKTKYSSLLADAHKIPFKNKTFDCVICNAVLEHVRQPEIVLSEINRVLKQDGLLWISVPFLQHIHADPYDFRRYTNYGIFHELESAGFEVKELHGSYGILDSIEYLLFAGVGWKIKDKTLKSMSLNSIMYFFVLLILFAYVRLFALIFDSMQKEDLHHAVSFEVISKKSREMSSCPR